MKKKIHYLFLNGSHLIDDKKDLSELKKVCFVRLSPGEKGLIYELDDHKVVGVAEYDRSKDSFTDFKEPKHLIYFIRQYEFWPESGTAFSHLNERERREIGRNRKRLILDLGGKNRKNVKKIRFFYSLVNGRPSRHYVVSAKNGDESDARISNIVCTSRVKYFQRYDWAKKAVLDDAQVREMRKLYKSGISRKELAARFKVSQGTVRNVVVGDNHYANR